MKRLWPLLFALACATGQPTGVPGLERMGATVLRYRGPELELALSYRYATLSLGEQWLILEVAMTAPAGKVTEVRRERVFLVAPDGRRIPLANQEQFARAYPQLQAGLRRAALATDPLDYFNRELTCSLEFFAAPGEGLVFPQVHVDDRRVCRGSLFFFVPEGLQPGTWTLAIDLVETRVRLPFQLTDR